MENKKLNIEKIKSQLDKLGFNQADIATKLNVSREAVSQWLKDNKFPKPLNLLELMNLLNLTVDEIILASSSEPIVSFRKKGNYKIKEEHIEQAKDMGFMLENLVPYLSKKLYSPPYFKNPIIDYKYIEEVSQDIREMINLKNAKINFKDLIDCFVKFQAILIPVLWGNKKVHMNALHILLPSSNTLWVYLNLDTNIYDFKFWMAHELGHIIASDLKDEESEIFADKFAGALLFPENLAEETYQQLYANHNNKGKQINIIKSIARELLISPITIYSQIKSYTDYYDKESIDLDIYPANTNFTKEGELVSKILFKENNPNTSEYISTTKETFKSIFFDVLKEYLKKENKSTGIITRMLNISFYDAKEIYQVLLDDTE